MGKLNLVTLLTVIVVQTVIGYLWYGPHLFGDVMKGHSIDVFKTDVMSIIFLVLTAYGMTHVLETHVKDSGAKDLSDGITLGLKVGSFMLGFPVIMLLNLLGGYSLDAILVIFGHLVLITIGTTLVLIKSKK
jgi:hypothetical protein